MHRVFCENIPGSGEYAEIEAREKEHLFKVFRASVGDEVELLDGAGIRASAVVEKNKMLRVGSVEKVEKPKVSLHLCCAIPKKQKLDQLLKQSGELGVVSIRPVRCTRSVAEGGSRERWDLHLREACKQSGNPFLPEIFPEEKLPAVLERLKKENIDIYFGDIPENDNSIYGSSRERAVLIGPEGGFTPEELELIRSYSAFPLNLGPYVLRLETAAICALAVLRKLPVLLVALGMLFICGCSERGDIEKNPLMLKAAQLREQGDMLNARKYFRRAVAVYPDEPMVYLALAQLCDEELNEPLEALFCYRMFLQLTLPDHPGRDSVERIVGHLQKKITENPALQAENEQLKKENARLRDKNKKIERRIIQQQLKINELYKKYVVPKSRKNR